MTRDGRNLSLPGNPRNQPKDLQGIFGYDNLYVPVGEVELALLETLHEVGLITNEEIRALTPEAREAILSIMTTAVDKIERAVTKHDIRAWVRIAEDVLPRRLARWLHVFFTSYDPIETARALQFQRAYEQVLRPKLQRTLQGIAGFVRLNAAVPQIGRTHGQHALPITVGFWMAEILSRLCDNTRALARASS